MRGGGPQVRFKVSTLLSATGLGTVVALRVSDAFVNVGIFPHRGDIHIEVLIACTQRKAKLQRGAPTAHQATLTAFSPRVPFATTQLVVCLCQRPRLGVRNRQARAHVRIGRRVLPDLAKQIASKHRDKRHTHQISTCTSQASEAMAMAWKAATHLTAERCFSAEPLPIVTCHHTRPVYQATGRTCSASSYRICP